jgi:hypothetical protein
MITLTSYLISTVRAVLGYLFLLAFVFLIVVVLMNLLNGLAVSDTAAIERVKYFYAESSSFFQGKSKLKIAALNTNIV